MIGKIQIFSQKLFKRQERGAIEIALMIGLLLLAVAVPITTKLVQEKNTDNRGFATGCSEQCPNSGQPSLLQSCHPADTDGSSLDSLCSFAGRIETCGSNTTKYCCPATGAAWTSNINADGCRGDFCSSMSLSTTKLSPGQKLRVNSTANREVNGFHYVVYNMDNMNTVNNPKPVCVASSVGSGDCPAGSAPLILSASSNSFRTSDGVDITYEQLFNIEDKNWGNQKPKRIKMNAYFSYNNGPYSLPKAECSSQVVIAESSSDCASYATKDTCGQHSNVCKWVTCANKCMAAGTTDQAACPSLTWNMTGVANCPAGTQLKQNVRLFAIRWPMHGEAQGGWNCSTDTASKTTTRNLTITSANLGNGMYFGLELPTKTTGGAANCSEGVAFQPKEMTPGVTVVTDGSTPDTQNEVVFGKFMNPSNWMVYWRRESLKPGNYTVKFDVPAEYCEAVAVDCTSLTTTEACNAKSAQCAWYNCANKCLAKGTPNDQACPGQYCKGEAKPADECPNSEDKNLLRANPECTEDGWDFEDSRCDRAGRVESCGGKKYCCASAGANWTDNMTACPASNKCTQCPNDPNAKRRGDANCDGQLGDADMVLWTNEFKNGGYRTEKNNYAADFNCDGFVDIDDRAIFTQTAVTSSQGGN